MALSIGSIATTFVAKTKPFEAGVNRVNRSLGGMSQKFSRHTMSASESFKLFSSSVIRQVGKLLAALGGLAMIKFFIGAAAKLEKDIIAIKTFVGSVEDAAALIQEIRTFAAKTPFELDNLIDATKILLAFGFSAETVGAQLFMMGNLAAAAGIPIEDVARIFGKVKAMGKLTTETLNQMSERGIPALSILAKHLGITEQQVREMVSQGLISFTMLQQAMWATAGAGGDMAGAMEEQSQTMAGLWSTLKDNIMELGLGVIAVLVEDVKRGIRVLIHLVKRLKEWIKANTILIKQLTVIGLKWAVFLAFFMAFIKLIPLAIKGIGLIARAMRALSMAQAALNASSGNILKLLAAFALAAGAFALIEKQFDIIEQQIAALIEEAGAEFELEIDDSAIDELAAKIGGLDTSVDILVKGTTAEASARIREKQQRNTERLLQKIVDNSADSAVALNGILNKPPLAVAGMV